MSLECESLTFKIRKESNSSVCSRRPLSNRPPEAAPDGTDVSSGSRVRGHMASRVPLAGSGAVSRDLSQVFACLVSQGLCCMWPSPSSAHTSLYPLSRAPLSRARFWSPVEEARSLLVTQETPSGSHGGEWNSSRVGFSPFRGLSFQHRKMCPPRGTGEGQEVGRVTMMPQAVAPASHSSVRV